jgi:hypothetical protein
VWLENTPKQITNTTTSDDAVPFLDVMLEMDYPDFAEHRDTDRDFRIGIANDLARAVRGFPDKILLRPVQTERYSPGLKSIGGSRWISALKSPPLLGTQLVRKRAIVEVRLIEGLCLDQKNSQVLKSLQAQVHDPNSMLRRGLYTQHVVNIEENISYTEILPPTEPKTQTTPEQKPPGPDRHSVFAKNRDRDFRNQIAQDLAFAVSGFPESVLVSSVCAKGTQGAKAVVVEAQLIKGLGWKIPLETLKIFQSQVSDPQSLLKRGKYTRHVVRIDRKEDRSHSPFTIEVTLDMDYNTVYTSPQSQAPRDVGGGVGGVPGLSPPTGHSSGHSVVSLVQQLKAGRMTKEDLFDQLSEIQKTNDKATIDVMSPLIPLYASMPSMPRSQPVFSSPNGKRQLTAVPEPILDRVSVSCVQPKDCQGATTVVVEAQLIKGPLNTPSETLESLQRQVSDPQSLLKRGEYTQHVVRIVRKEDMSSLLLSDNSGPFTVEVTLDMDYSIVTGSAQAFRIQISKDLARALDAFPQSTNNGSKVGSVRKVVI